MEEIVGLSTKERARLVELEQVKAGRQAVVAAAERLEIVPHPISWTVDGANHAASWRSSRCATAGVR